MNDGLMILETAFLLITSLAFALGFTWLKQPPLLGYIAAGILLGPSFVKLIQYSPALEFLGEMGVLMLLFVVGQELDLHHFKKIWKKAISCIFLQLLTSFIIAFSLQACFGFSNDFRTLLIFVRTLSSTAIAVKLLEEMGELNSQRGSLTVSILIAQDLSLIPMILILKGLGGESVKSLILIKLAISISCLFLLIKYLTKESNRILNPLKNIFQGSQETMTLAGVTVCFVFGAISGMLGLSHAYGSFLGGLILGSFGNKKEILQFLMPISSMLIMIFFLSVGSNLQVDYLMKNSFLLLSATFAVILGKTLINYTILRFLNCTKEDSIFIAMNLSQFSEFSFSLVAIFSQVAFLSLENKNFLNALIVLSLTFGSIWPIIGRTFLNRNKVIEQ